MKNTFYWLDNDYFISMDLMEQICAGKGIKDNSCIIDESERCGYVAKFEDDILEIYVPDSVSRNDVVLDDVGNIIPEEYKYRIKKLIFGDRIKDIFRCNFETFGNIEKVYFGADVEIIAPGNFLGNFNLTKFEVSNSNKHFKSYQNDLFSYDMKTLISYAPGKRDSFYEIPQFVEIIGSHAFTGAAGLKCVKVGANVKTIDYMAFFDAWSLRHIYIDKNVTAMQDPCIFGSHDELQIFLCEWYLVVGGPANCEAARWCKKQGVKFHTIEDNEIDDFLALPLPDTKDDQYLMRASKELDKRK